MKPTHEARAALDRYIKGLAQSGDGLTIEEFRIASLERAQRVEWVVRATLYSAGLGFMLLLLASLLFYPAFADRGLLWIGIWALSLGGLGAIASIFLNVLKLMPTEALQQSDEMEVVGRIFLGCLFSLVLSLTLLSGPLMQFFHFIGSETVAQAAAGPTGVGRQTGVRPAPGGLSDGLKLLLPFLCGYSIPLVLGLLGKAIMAIEITFGLDDRRTPPPAKGTGRRKP